MALNDTDEKLLIRYLDGDLGDPERAALEARLPAEPELRASLDRLQLATRAVHWNALREQVAAARQQHEGASEPVRSEAPVRSLRWLRTAVAAAAVLAGLWIGVRWWDSSHLTPEQVYSRHFIEYELPAERGNEINADVEAAYGQRKFDQVYAFRHRDTLLSERQRLLLALAALQLGKASEAETRLQSLAAGHYGDDAGFYRALALIRAGRAAEALALLRAIRNQPTHLYHSRVTDAFIEQVADLK